MGHRAGILREVDAEALAFCKPPTRHCERSEAIQQLLPAFAMRCGEDGRLSLLSPYGAREWIETSNLRRALGGPPLARPRGSGGEGRGSEGRVGRGRAGAGGSAVGQCCRRRSPVRGIPASWQQRSSPVPKGRGVWRTWENFVLAACCAPGSPTSSSGGTSQWRFIDKLPSAELGKRRDRDILELFEAVP